MHMKPVIGILPLFDEKKESYVPNKKFVWGV